MFEKIALAYLLELNQRMMNDCGFNTSEFDADFLESIIEDPEGQLLDAKEKFDNLMANIHDKDTRKVYYSFYYQGQIDGILSLFRLKGICSAGERNKH